MVIAIPLHPRVESVVKKHGICVDLRKPPKVSESIHYLDTLLRERNVRLMVIDPAGAHKKPFSCRMPSVTLREETERVELVQLGRKYLCGPVAPWEFASVLASTERARGRVEFIESSSYSDGQAAINPVREHCFAYMSQFRVARLARCAAPLKLGGAYPGEGRVQESA